MTARDVTPDVTSPFRGTYVCDGRRFFVDAYNTVYEDVGDARVCVGCRSGRSARAAIAAIMNAERDS